MRSDDASARVTRLVTLLDAIVIVLASAAVVMALGARKRIEAGPFVLSLRDPARAVILAAAAGLVRWFVVRRQRFLPSIPLRAIGARIAEERARLERPIPAAPHVKYYAAISALASLLWLTPHILNIRHVPDPYDPLLSSWRLARLAHQALNEPTRLFDGNIFHPAQRTLTYSDATILEAIAALPFLAAGANPIIVSNVLLIASFPLCALAFFFTAWRLTGDAQAGCIAGVLGGLAPFKTLHYNHLELQFFCFAPLAVLALLRLVVMPSWRTGAAFGSLVAAQWLACMYFGVMQFLFLAPVALLAAAAWGQRPSRRLAAAMATFAVIVVTAFGLVAIPFMRMQAEHGGRAIEEVRFFSADLRSYATPHRQMKAYGNVASPPSAKLQEAALFPGSVTLVLAAIGVAPPVSVGAAAVMAATAASLEGSLGTNGLIYDELFEYLRPVRGMRVPARFGAFVATGLALLSGYGAWRLLRLARTWIRRGIVFAALMIAALLDLRPALPLDPYPRDIPAIYARVTPDMVLAELPMESRANFSFMYFSTFHWARLINGDSGYFPTGYFELTEAMASFPHGGQLNLLRQRGVTHMTVNCYFFATQENCAELLTAMDAMGELEYVSASRWQGKEVRLYAVR